MKNLNIGDTIYYYSYTFKKDGNCEYKQSVNKIIALNTRYLILDNIYFTRLSISDADREGQLNKAKCFLTEFCSNVVPDSFCVYIYTDKEIDQSIINKMKKAIKEYANKYLWINQVCNMIYSNIDVKDWIK